MTSELVNYIAKQESEKSQYVSFGDVIIFNVLLTLVRIKGKVVNIILLLVNYCGITWLSVTKHLVAVHNKWLYYKLNLLINECDEPYLTNKIIFVLISKNS